MVRQHQLGCYVASANLSEPERNSVNYPNGKEDESPSGDHSLMPESRWHCRVAVGGRCCLGFFSGNGRCACLHGHSYIHAHMLKHTEKNALVLDCDIHTGTPFQATLALCTQLMQRPQNAPRRKLAFSEVFFVSFQSLFGALLQWT